MLQLEHKIETSRL
uniref:Uncharacterized protein n=1 Tax=Arundo donax TaxID=35708 RepID=A0A0A9GC95_ARUDO